jgi:uncharacterized protein YwgA
MDRSFTLLHLVSVCGQISGRKKLQKIVHILKEAGHPFDFHYRYHFHGPFSAELKGDIDALTNEGLLEEKAESAASSEFTTYSFSVCDRGLELLDDVFDTDDIDPPWATLANEMNQKSPRELEAISTLIFLYRQGRDDDQVREKFLSLKPHLERLYNPALQSAKQIIGEQASSGSV